MGIYREKPTLVEAVQVRKENARELMDFITRNKVPYEVVGEVAIVINTPHGDLVAKQDDWLVCGRNYRIDIYTQKQFKDNFEKAK